MTDPNAEMKVAELLPIASLDPIDSIFHISEEDFASCSSDDYTSDDEYDALFQSVVEKRNEGGAMNVHEIAQLLGSVKFDEVQSDLPSLGLSQKLLPRVSCHGIDTTHDILKNRSPIGSCHGSSLPPQKQTIDNGTSAINYDTSSFLIQILDDILKENGFENKKIPSDQVPSDFFEEIKEENTDAYTSILISLVRSQDISQLEKMLEEGYCFQACNKFGESILHLACRRGCIDVARFLIEKAQISVNVLDDYGRTCLHDACWVSTPDFELIEMIIRESPSLIIIKDKRGFTPLQYVKGDYYAAWATFLKQNKNLLRPTI